MKKREIIFVATLFGLSSTMMAEIPEGFDTETKWHTTFTNDANEFEWPAGATYGSSVQTKQNGGRWVTYSNTDPDDFKGFVITPLLHASAGETMIVEARCNSSYQDADGINIYMASTREGLASPDTRTPLLSLSGTSADVATKLIAEVKQYSFTIPEEGDYYIGFSLYDRGQIAGLYGLELVAVPHAWSIAPGSIPSTAIQNHETQGSFKILNYGQQDEKAGTYTITTFVNGVATEKPGTVDIKAEHLLGADGVEVPFTFRSPRPGTVTVQAVVNATDGYSITSEPFEVEVTKEILSAEKMVGNGGTTVSGYPLDGTWDNSETLVLYTPDKLCLTPGEKIKQIYLNGYVTGNAVGSEAELRVCYAWTDDTTLAKPTNETDPYDYSSMNVAVDKTITWEAMGSSSALVPVIVLDFDEPLVYEEGKSLLLLFHYARLNYKSGTNFEAGSPANPNTAWRKHVDNKKVDGVKVPGNFAGSWSAIEMSPIHLVLDVQPRSLSGVVTVGSEGVADAVVTLISNDGDNVQYEGISDSDGNYSIDVIQSDRIYDMEVATDGFGEFDEELSFADASVVKDIELRKVVRISDNSSHNGGAGNAIVYFDKKLNLGYNLVALPISLSSSEVSEIFGEEAKIFTFDKDIDSDGTILVNFNDYFGELEAGRPYLIYVEDETKDMFWSMREASESLSSINGTNLSIESTTAPLDITEGMVAMNNSLVNEENSIVPDANATLRNAGNVTIPAYSGYFSLNPGKDNVSVFLNNTNIGTGIETIFTDPEKTDEVYDLNGYRVVAPSKGIYVINGKLILVK